MLRVRCASAALAIAVIGACVSGCGSEAKPPADRVQAFFQSLQSSDPSACESLVPDQRAKCTSDWGEMGLRGQDFAIHRTVIDGDRALVSVTGTSCSVAGCRTVTDSESGMPKDGVSFDQAWKTLTASPESPENSAMAAVRLIKADGAWFIQP